MAFEYSAHIAWPNNSLVLQPDWVDSVNLLEAWLNKYVGPELETWCYVHSEASTNTHAHLAFLRSQDRLLCLLQWAN